MIHAPANAPKPEAGAPSSPAEELKKLRDEEAKAEETREAEEQARELEELRLASRLRGELGVRGKDFEVVNTPYIVFGVRKPDAQGIAQINKAVDEKTPNVDRIIGILRNYIVPDEKKNEFHLVAAERPGVATGANSAMAAFLGLAGAIRFDAKKK